MCIQSSGAVTRFIAVSTAALAIALTPASAHSDAAPAQGDTSLTLVNIGGATLPLTELEQAFWFCDHAATTRGIEATPAELCSDIYDALKTHKFGGDFDALLEWWRANKPLQHARLTGTE
jgi:hypothetical protein